MFNVNEHFSNYKMSKAVQSSIQVYGPYGSLEFLIVVERRFM